MPEIQHSFQQTGACLYLCSTPIGNLQDVSLRLLEVLRTADIVAAEDTRHSRKLFTHFDIHVRTLVSYHQHNRRSRAEDFVRWWQEGKSIALLTDAGTPGISDPGDDAVTLAIAHNVPVIPVPGASAVLAALVASGLPSLPFTFAGFLPRDKREAERYVQTLAGVPGSIVFYEAPHRLPATLALLDASFPARAGVVAKELTKQHETFIRGSLSELAAYARAEQPRGEYVIIVGPKSPEDAAADLEDGVRQAQRRMEAAVAKVRAAMKDGRSHREAVKQTAAELGVRRAELYRLTLDEME
ncbi:16S rRNA (cytidine(1402)-2'-O)-methyltransferase [Alicyclobacillus cycloheptanicus]|uniref:Ribosomal RNA small subunit methyltransferase I n=1 Tax=Alicyclobacillus cycloheptanicus TaxID=1457 RepID=A0ABT9XIP8_9BACL|nr:16S rRNA (cytidine(1402)-2'-O)-methyltransferase [Alicyclobacillus cycloheptanicus]MDQ0190180.1 16S rRNA (cytidine1402-2'-O)-methyltransferase [Alicyclobacillus cycloheptanicus]WDM02568.1 16S rRNA (cytidine(1402)-2'-O)-methyltransferase [Alicyclobacillus cycloheptanicus]